MGVLLVAVGVAGAVWATRRLERTDSSRLLPVAVAPTGVLIGGGAALVRDWDTLRSSLGGMVLLPVMTLVAQWLERRRRHEGRG